MSDAVYRCRSCKTKVTIAMPICPICGEPITPQMAQLNAGSSASATGVSHHNLAAHIVSAMPMAPEPQPAPMPQTTPLLLPMQNAVLQQMWTEMVAEMATLKTPDAIPSRSAYPYPAPSTKARMTNRSFALYVACVVMVLVGSFLIGIGLARRYTASEQAAQNLAAPAKVIVMQAPAGVGGPLVMEAGDKAK